MRKQKDKPTAGDRLLEPTLRAMAERGLSGSAIADELSNGMSANAIYGACWRLGITLNRGRRGRHVGFKFAPGESPRRTSDESINVDEAIASSNHLKILRRTLQPMCIYAGCSRASIQGRVWCEDHRSSLSSGIVKPVCHEVA